ncbi:unnamed protein product [Ceratitis capitata]|uniref:Actin-related protein 2/3 complex subunit 5 n=1 Tax=Ceratitis capitata TaxID=7213 RepID=A0A811USN0_CERCA|nr:unnamed protein product [Ceratitis capitata]
MAKNTSSSAFRKIDVDQYNEDNFKEDEADAISATVGPDENEITTLLTQGKDNALNTTLRVLLSIKSSQMDQAVEALEQNDLLDVLMKYIYRGFEIPSEGSSGHLLQWHEKHLLKVVLVALYGCFRIRIVHKLYYR